MGDGEIPEEIVLAKAINRYGVYGVFGRPMSALDINRIGIAENIIRICAARGNAAMHAEWEGSNPEAAAVFKYAMGLAIDKGLIDD